MSFLSRLMGGPDGAPAAANTAELSPADFVAQRDPDAPVIDVRTPGEFAGGHLAGARNVDVFAPDFQQQIEALGLPERGPVYLYCRSGNRSGKAAQILHEMGHAGAVNVGGFQALARAGAETD
jgi:rhodanese-related sulfurtransferase